MVFMKECQGGGLKRQSIANINGEVFALHPVCGCSINLHTLQVSEYKAAEADNTAQWQGPVDRPGRKGIAFHRGPLQGNAAFFTLPPILRPPSVGPSQRRGEGRWCSLKLFSVPSAGSSFPQSISKLSGRVVHVAAASLSGPSHQRRSPISTLLQTNTEHHTRLPA
ncbi:hypothetical protein OPT61_g10189 [Boeremia exigua]|uniref:Uncharacterized protein n=1 Tax=Boeremia exigua TaxID=749465 RepID=A0ACC2HRB1_9PLEO|nr:hypothetical protein OPT61_g10189 [Boeremia exigua]